MKMKTLGMLTMSGLLTAAFAYGVPALADDTTPASSDNAQATQPAAADTTQNTGALTDPSSGTSGTSGTSSTATDSSGSSSDGTADMPSGDDDY